MSVIALLVLAGATEVSEFETALFAQTDEDQSNRLSLRWVVEQSKFARRLHVVVNKPR